MSINYLSVQVPEGDLDDLASLVRKLGDSSIEPLFAHPFDGALLVQIVVPITALNVAILRTWILSRKEARKAMRVVADGVDISGYTAAEVSKILNSLVAPTQDGSLTEGNSER